MSEVEENYGISSGDRGFRQAKIMQYVITPAVLLSSSQGSFSERVGFLIHFTNMAILITFPAAVVLLVPSITPGSNTDAATVKTPYISGLIID